MKNNDVYSFKALAILLGISRDKLKHLLDYFNISPCKEGMHAGRVSHYYDDDVRKFIDEQLKKDINWKDVFTKKFYDEHPEVRDNGIIKIKETMMNRYGVDNPSKVKEFQDKKTDTFLKNHNGVSQSDYMRTVAKEFHNSGRFKESVVRNFGSLENYYLSAKLKREQTNISNYGNLENYYKHVHEKSVESLHEKYGNDIDNVSQIEHVRKKISDTKKSITDEQKNEILNKNKQTCFERYGVESYSQTNEFLEKQKDSCMKKYNAEHYTKSAEYQNNVTSYMKKQYDTKRKNNTFHVSALEEEFSKWLHDNNFCFVEQYRDDRYPYTCDFYLLEYDIFVEIQGTWTHGGHPFDENNIEDITKLNFWKSKNTKYYDNAIYTWTKLDVRKRKIAKENCLKYIEIFSSNTDEIKYIFDREFSKYVKDYKNR